MDRCGQTYSAFKLVITVSSVTALFLLNSERTKLRICEPFALYKQKHNSQGSASLVPDISHLASHVVDKTQAIAVQLDGSSGSHVTRWHAYHGTHAAEGNVKTSDHC